MAPSFLPVDGTDIVETSAGDEAPRGRVGAGHDPGGAQRDGVHLVGAVAVPDDQLAVLGGGNKISGKGRETRKESGTQSGRRDGIFFIFLKKGGRC